MVSPLPLDPTVVGDLRSQIGDEAVRDILGRFAANGRQLIPVIVDAGSSLEDRAEAAHSLKGACAVVGLTRAADLCMQIENAWRDGLHDQGERIAAELQAVFDADRALLEGLF